MSAFDVQITFWRDWEAGGEQQFEFLGTHGPKGMVIDEAEPGEIVVEVLRGDALKPAHPFFESTMKGVDVLDVINLLDNAQLLCCV